MILQVGVKVLLRNRKGEYLFIERTKKLESGDRAQWDIPGGRTEEGELLDEALRREVREEIGVDIEGAPQLVNAQDIFVPAKDLHVVRLTYTLDFDVDIQEVKLSDEHQNMAWLTPDDALFATEPYLAETLKLIAKV